MRGDLGVKGVSSKKKGKERQTILRKPWGGVVFNIGGEMGRRYLLREKFSLKGKLHS